MQEARGDLVTSSGSELRQRTSSQVQSGGALSGGAPHLTLNSKDLEIERLLDENKKLKGLLDAKIAVRTETSIISDFHGEDENEEEEVWWDVFSIGKRVSPSKSPVRQEILDKYNSYGLLKGVVGFFDHFYCITQRKTTFATEASSGITTFFAMAYILALNPIIVSGAIGAQYKSGIFFSTCLASGVFTLLMGILANLPVALAPGMGLNGYFANVARVAADGTLVGILTFQQGMAAILLSGVVYLLLTVTGLRFLLFKAVPMDLRHAMSAGIGLFICTIGYKIGCILGISYYGGPIANSTAMLPYYDYDIVQIPLPTTAAGRVTVLGLMWVSLLVTLGLRSAILVSIVLTTACGISGNGLGADSVTSLAVWAQQPIPFVADTSNLIAGQLDFSAALTPHFWDVAWTFIFVEMFDSFGTLSTIMMKSGIGAGNRRKADRAINNAMLIDGWGLLLGSLAGSNSITPFVESLTGIVAGARTGVASVVTGGLFLLSLLFVYPFVAIIPDSATVPALFMVTS